MHQTGYTGPTTHNTVLLEGFRWFMRWFMRVLRRSSGGQRLCQGPQILFRQLQDVRGPTCALKEAFKSCQGIQEPFSIQPAFQKASKGAMTYWNKWDGLKLPPPPPHPKGSFGMLRLRLGPQYVPGPTYISMMEPTGLFDKVLVCSVAHVGLNM